MGNCRCRPGGCTCCASPQAEEVAALRLRAEAAERKVEALQNCHSDLPNPNCGCLSCTAVVVDGLQREAETQRERADEIEAGAAALREAMEDAEYINGVCPVCQGLAEDHVKDGCVREAAGHHPGCTTLAALATDAGAALLERLRKAEEERDEAEGWLNDAHLGWQKRCSTAETALHKLEASVRAEAEERQRVGSVVNVTAPLSAPWNWKERCIGCIFAVRLLRAAQSLHRAWGRARAEVVKLMDQRDEAVARQLSADSDRIALLAERDALNERISDEHLCAHGARSCDACTDSWSVRARALVVERDALKGGLVEKDERLDDALNERDALRAEVERLRAERDRIQEHAKAVQHQANDRAAEVERLRDVAALAQALLERWDMDAGLGLLRVETEQWAERIHYLRAALAAKKGGG